MLEKSFVEKCWERVLERSVVDKGGRRVLEKSGRRVMEKSVLEASWRDWRKELERSVGEKHF